jgi:hypothetical protein
MEQTGRGIELEKDLRTGKQPTLCRKRKGMGHPKNLGESEFKWWATRQTEDGKSLTHSSSVAQWGTDTSGVSDTPLTNVWSLVARSHRLPALVIDFLIGENLVEHFSKLGWELLIISNGDVGPQCAVHSAAVECLSKVPGLGLTDILRRSLEDEGERGVAQMAKISSFASDIRKLN